MIKSNDLSASAKKKLRITSYKRKQGACYRCGIIKEREKADFCEECDFIIKHYLDTGQIGTLIRGVFHVAKPQA